MGQRLEQNRTKVTDNRNETERIKGEQTTLANEYSPLREIDAFLDSLDDEIIGSVEQVQEVGVSEQSRLNTEKEQTRSEANEIVSDLDAEIGKLDAGMKKLDQIETFGFGQQGVEKGKTDYQKQIEQYRALKAELEEIQESGDTSNLDQVMGNYADQISELNLDPENSGREIGSNSISNISFSGIVNGNDISAIIDEHFDRVAPYSTATGFRDRFADELLLKIADAQGYNRAPRIVNENEFNQYAQASGYIGFRTLGKSDDDSNPAKYVDEFEHMDNIVYNPTDARVYGDGLYIALNRDAQKGVFPNADEVDSARISSAEYGDYDFKAQVKITFDPSARIISENDLEIEFRNDPNRERFFDNQKNPPEYNRNAYAAAKGYDVILLPNAGYRSDYAVVLNRTKMVVQDGFERVENLV